jgi:hypothetical protein
MNLSVLPLFVVFVVFFKNALIVAWLEIFSAKRWGPFKIQNQRANK